MVAPAHPTHELPPLFRAAEFTDRDSVRRALAGIRLMLRRIRADRRETAAMAATPATIGAKDQALRYADKILSGLENTEAALVARLSQLPKR